MSYAHAEPGDLIKHSYDRALKSAGHSLWDSLKKVGASSFGKGVLLTAAVFIAAVAIFGGAMGSTGALKIGEYAANAEQGFASGIARAAGILFLRPIGWAMLAVGGTLGAVHDARAHHAQETMIEAERISMELEQLRQKQLQPAIEAEKPKANEMATAQEQPKEKQFCAAEAKRDEKRQEHGNQNAQYSRA